MTAGEENESKKSAARRRRKQARRWLTELALALAFVASIYGAGHVGRTDPPSAMPTALFVAAAVVVLALWVFAYVCVYRSLDEFEQYKELKALALAGAVAVFLGAAWGIMEALLGAPEIPLALIAPTFSAAYAIISVFIASRFR